MKKILVAQEISDILQRKNSFLERGDMLVFTAASNDEALGIHRAERADLVITHLELPGMDVEQFCSLIRQKAAPGAVSLIMVCSNNRGSLEKSSRCRADAVLLRPVKSALIMAKAKQLLNINWRETYRVLLNVSVEGSSSEQMFACRSLDLSTTGMRIETEHSFRQGDRVICSFFLPDAKTTHIEATGEIARIIPPGPGTGAGRYGVHFLDLSDDARKALGAFLNANPR
jgi:DNA-binding response OmpR family regulator